MANYSLIVNSKFRPFEYQELLAPVLSSTTAHKEIEEAYGNLATEASIWNKRTEGSERAHKLYTEFNKDLEEAADTLSKYGLTPQSRRALLGMKQRYASDITPIAEAWAKRQADLKAQQELSLKDPTRRFDKYAQNMSLDDYLDNPNIDIISTNISGALLEQQAGMAASNLKQVLREKAKQFKGTGLPYQYERWLQYGVSELEIDKAINGDPNADPTLLNIINSVMESSGIKRWSSMNDNWEHNDTYNEMLQHVRRGLYNSLGKTDYQAATDQAGLTTLQYNLQDRNNKSAANRSRRDKDAYEYEDNIVLRPYSYLVTSGKDKEYLEVLQGLKAGTNGVKASVFGKDGTVNAMKVYDEYKRAGKSTLTKDQIKSIDREVETRVKKQWDKQNSNVSQQQRAIAANRLNQQLAREKTAEYNRVARDTILKKYGVSQVLSADQYNILKNLGYNGERITSMDQFKNAINNLSQERTYYSTAMSNYDYPDEVIRRTLGTWEANGQFAGRVYKLNADGTMGGGVEYDDLNLLSEDNTKGVKVTDIAYSDVTPNKIIVKLGNKGGTYLVDPNVLGINDFIEKSRVLLKDVPSTERAQTITKGIVKLLNSYNPTASTTSSKV